MIRDVALSLVTRAALIVAGVLTSVITARALGVTGRGEYFFVITLAGLAAQLGNLGLPSSNTYVLARDKTLLSSLAANNAWISVVVGTAASCVILVAKADPAEPRLVDPLLWIVFLMVPTMIYCVLASNLLVGLSLIRSYNIFQIASTAFQVLAIGVAAWMGWGVFAFLLISVLTGAISAAVLARVVGRLQRPIYRFDWPLFRSELGYSARAYLVTLFGYALTRVGVLLIDAFAGTTEVGIYSVAIQFADVLAILPATVAVVFFPDLLRGPRENRFTRTWRTAAQVAAIMLVLAVLTGVAAIWIVPLLFGEAFVPAVAVLWWMLPGTVALAYANIVSQYLAAVGMPPANVWALLASLIVVLLAGRCLIPEWGAIGAAMSLTIAYGLLAPTLLFVALRYARLEARASTQT